MRGKWSAADPETIAKSTRLDLNCCWSPSPLSPGDASVPCEKPDPPGESPSVTAAELSELR